MNKLNFSNTGGFPLDTNILAFMQDAYDLLNALGELAGDLTILKGCTVTGSTVSDGVVYINGEVLAFKGGSGTQVIIKEDVTELPFEDGFNKEVEKVRYATFGVASTSYLWADFIRINPMKIVQRSAIPVGMISLWSGSPIALPDGWVLCDGTNGTPDLRGRFIVGYNPNDTDYNAIGKVGGAKQVTLTIDQMPAHTHSYQAPLTSGDHPGGSSGYDRPNSIESGTTGSRGGNQAHENRPPYYALAYIMFKG